MSTLTIESHELRRLISEAVEIGVSKALGDIGEKSSFISQREAYRLYGAGNVKRWVKERLVIRKKDGERNSTIRYDRIELEILSKTNNR